MLEFQLRDLQDATNSKVLRGAVAACMLGNGDAEAAATLFTDAGWSRTDDAEMGMVSLTPTQGDATVTLYENGRICDVTSEVWGGATALGALQVSVMLAGFQLVSDQTSECARFALTDMITVDLTSSGQDPVCISESNSNVRFTFASAN